MHLPKNDCTPTHPNASNPIPPAGQTNFPHVVLIGGGFTGLTAAYHLSRSGIRVTVLEKDTEVGGLAGSFSVNGQPLEKFYHHWFTNDRYVMELVKELKVENQVIYRPTRTGIYYANNFFKLSTPTDLIKFNPLSWFNRIRLGLVVLQARQVKDWKILESLTAREWLLKLCGREVYQVVWEPLLRGKFGTFASDVSAVWFWNKIKLRGSSRSKDGAEMLAYYRGGFAALAQKMAQEITNQGGQIKTNTPVDALVVQNGRVVGVKTVDGITPADAVIATVALPIVANLVEPHTSVDYTQKLRQIKYLANVCLVLELDRSLSQTYWLNVNDPNFPFVGIIEHTNFESTETYGGRHIVYLSKYLPDTAQLYLMSDEEALNFSIPYIQKMFPEFHRDWIIDYHFWRAQYSQPIVVRYYSHLIPENETPLGGLYLSTMAQIYPEDRGTNYAIREGKKVADLVLQKIKAN
jgi:protoporphyrinogen oxidase